MHRSIGRNGTDALGKGIRAYRKPAAFDQCLVFDPSHHEPCHDDLENSSYADENTKDKLGDNRDCRREM
ncbi:MAG: hypothetical protein ACM3IL_03475, partial [Deltaproteobacteria bacterium]